MYTLVCSPLLQIWLKASVLVIGVLLVLGGLLYKIHSSSNPNNVNTELSIHQPTHPLLLNTPSPLSTSHTPTNLSTPVSRPESHPLLNSTLPADSDLQDHTFLSIFTDGYIYDKFTIVMPTYKRTENLFAIMDQYCDFTDIIDRIMILWNNIGRLVPKDLTARAEKCAVPVVIRVMERNNLTSRFYPYSQIKTAG